MEQGNTLTQEGLSRNAKVAAALAQIDEQSRSAGEHTTTAIQEQGNTATLLSSNLQSIVLAHSEQREVVSNLAVTAQELNALAADLWREVDRFRWRRRLCIGARLPAITVPVDIYVADPPQSRASALL